jgi:hypothetical protein
VMPCFLRKSASERPHRPAPMIAMPSETSMSFDSFGGLSSRH